MLLVEKNQYEMIDFYTNSQQLIEEYIREGSIYSPMSQMTEITINPIESTTWKREILFADARSTKFARNMLAFKSPYYEIDARDELSPYIERYMSRTFYSWDDFPYEFRFDFMLNLDIGLRTFDELFYGRDVEVQWMKGKSSKRLYDIGTMKNITNPDTEVKTYLLTNGAIGYFVHEELYATKNKDESTTIYEPMINQLSEDQKFGLVVDFPKETKDGVPVEWNSFYSDSQRQMNKQSIDEDPEVFVFFIPTLHR